MRKLDTLSARTTTARTHLTAIAKLVEKYKRLVIGQLCLGGVASQFEDQKELPELPFAWEWSRAEDLCHWITKGTTPSKGELFAGSGDVPFIKVYNLTFSDRLDFSIEPTFVGCDTHNIALKRSKLFPGDVLINIVGPPLGKTAIVPDDFPEWNMNQAIAVFRPKERLYNRFLLYWLSSEWFLSWALSRSKATAGQRNLTLEICRDTPVPLPSFDEQREIVRRIETAFAKINRLAAEAEKALKLTDRLDQRILAKAFAGALVPQDPTDEPATELLARVREARATAPKPKRGRRKKVAT
ncbi:restriction endonuclease subunit S [Roseovarius sp. C7]|uniref:restriction endonuclease subunit S n=1 Tax=Roseovarius sp. C7 TaxID=3398643 RepID=UPI0039F5BC36